MPHLPLQSEAPPRLRVAVVGLVTVLALAACGGDGPAATDDSAGPGGEGETDFPLTIENCGHELTFEAPPERVLLLHSAPVTSFQALDLLDRVVARAGAFPDAYLDDEAQETIAAVPSLADEIDADGHFEISQEAVIAEEPDLVMGDADGVSREGLADAGIQQLIVPSQCPGADETPDYDDVYALNDTYGQIFDRPDAARAYNDELRGRVEDVAEQVRDEERTAATLYPTVGGGAGWAYGTISMAHPQLEAAGFTNVFDDVDERVFEVTHEELIARDPDVLVLLHIDGEPGPVENTIRSLPGAEDMTAVANNDILVQLFNFTEPPTPLTVDGLEHIVDEFETTP
ncbi:MAG: ABC transporter substrate-binding protein [Nitriliruptoraceae bacterium]